MASGKINPSSCPRCYYHSIHNFRGTCCIQVSQSMILQSTIWTRTQTHKHTDLVLTVSVARISAATLSSADRCGLDLYILEVIAYCRAQSSPAVRRAT